MNANIAYSYISHVIPNQFYHKMMVVEISDFDQLINMLVKGMLGRTMNLNRKQQQIMRKRVVGLTPWGKLTKPLQYSSTIFLLKEDTY